MKKFNGVIIGLLLIGQVVSSLAQTTQGKEFWVSLMRNNNNSSEIKIIISAKDSCTGSISNPNTGWSTSFSLGNDSYIEIDIPKIQCYIDSVNKINNKKGLFIQSTDTISVYAANFQTATFDAANILPITALMDDYIIQTYQGYTNDLGASLMVLATEDSTEVDITPLVETKDGHAALITYTKFLNKGEVYYTEAKSAKDLSGTQIKSKDCKKIAVFNGNALVQVPKGYAARDHIFEQMFPIAYWGKKFIVVNTKTRNRDRIKITATSAAATNVYKNGTLLTTLSPYQSHEFELISTEKSCYLQSDKPVAVQLYITSGTYYANSTNTGDPAMVWISPMEQSIKDLTFGTFQPSKANTKKHYINVITKTSGASVLTLDGVNQSSQFVSVNGNPDYMCLQLEVSHGAHHLICDSGFVGVVYGLGNIESYAYSMGSSTRNLNRQIVVNDVPEFEGKETQTYCLDSPIKFYPIAEEQITDVIWNFGDGTPQISAKITDTLYHNYMKEGVYQALMILDTRAYCNDFDTIKAVITIKGFSYTYTADVCAGDLFDFQGNLIEAYQDTILKHFLKNNIGCDSIIYCNLSVNQNYNDTITAQICYGEGYHKNGFNVPENTLSGIVYQNLNFKTIKGCDSVTILKLTIHNLQDTTFADTACNIYEWNDKQYTTSGFYTQQFMTSEHCDSMVTVDLWIIDTAIIILYQEDALCDQENVVLEAVTDLTSFRWFYEGEEMASNSRMIQVSEGGNYQLIAKEQECEGHYSIDLLDCNYEVHFPNIFTPNGDGINDEFYPTTEGIVSEEMYIYDRWGSLIYKWIEMGSKWNGATQRGREMPAGVYYYIYKAKGPFDREVIKHGSITLMR